jgi:hypothetical protein
MPLPRLNSEAIAEHLRALSDLPAHVVDWDVEVGPDATEDLAVWVWLTLDDDDFEDLAKRAKLLRRVRDSVALMNLESDPWVYVRFRARSETALP